MEMRVLSGADDDLTRIALRGRLDLKGGGEIEADFDAEVASRGRGAVVDLGEVSFLASPGMRLLVRAAKELRRGDHRLVLLRPQENVKQALEIAGLLDVLPVADDEAAALVLARGHGLPPG